MCEERETCTEWETKLVSRTYEEWVPSAADIEACGIQVGDDVFFLVN